MPTARWTPAWRKRQAQLQPEWEQLHTDPEIQAAFWYLKVLVDMPKPTSDSWDACLTAISNTFTQLEQLVVRKTPELATMYGPYLQNFLRTQFARGLHITGPLPWEERLHLLSPDNPITCIGENQYHIPETATRKDLLGLDDYRASLRLTKPRGPRPGTRQQKLRHAPQATLDPAQALRAYHLRNDAQYSVRAIVRELFPTCNDYNHNEYERARKKVGRLIDAGSRLAQKKWTSK